MRYGRTAPNRTVCVPPPSAAPEFHSPRSAAPPTAHSTHSLSALQTLRVCLFGPPNRRIQPERYAKFGLKFFQNIKPIDIIIKIVYKYTYEEFVNEYKGNFLRFCKGYKQKRH
jgi:hypothetical protein